MTVIPNGMPFDKYQVMQAQIYGAPVHPNSENIPPPVQKEKKRVVEAATRTAVDINLLNDTILEKWMTQKDYVQKGMEDLRMRMYHNKKEIEQGVILDIEV